MDRVFLDEPPSADGRLTITGPVRHHLADSLRVRPGDTFLATDGRGAERLLEVESADRRSLVVIVREERLLPPGPGRSVTLAVAPPKGSRMETAIEKATEIGVGRILPMRTARSVVKGRGDSEKAERWERVAASATAQSGRAHAPEVLPTRTFDEALVDLGEGTLLIAHAGLDAVSPVRALDGLRSGDPVAVLIGPEGGFSEEEVERARVAGARAITLGENRLRTETAAIVAVTLTIAAVESLGRASPRE